MRVRGTFLVRDKDHMSRIEKVDSGQYPCGLSRMLRIRCRLWASSAANATLGGMQDNEKMERLVTQIRRVGQGLNGLTFPPLRRPQPAPNGAPTTDLLNWAAKLYGSSLLSHFREMLRSFLFLGENGHVPAGFVVCRCLFEMGAHAYYVHKHVTQFLDAGDFTSAWNFLQEVNMGSRYMREEYGDRPDMPPFAAPREVGKVIRCFDEWTGHTGQALTEYSFLSEFAHPNMAAFQHYYELKRGRSGDIQAEFSAQFSSAPLPDISIALVSALHFVLRLLEKAGETQVAPRLATLLAEYTSHAESSSKPWSS